VAVRPTRRLDARVHGHIADSVGATDAIEGHLRRSGPCDRAGRERSVKPSAQPTLVRTQHLPPPETPVQGRYGVPDSGTGHAARCRCRLPLSAGYTRDRFPAEPQHPRVLQADDRPAATGIIHPAARRLCACWRPCRCRLGTSRRPGARPRRCARRAQRPVQGALRHSATAKQPRAEGRTGGGPTVRRLWLTSSPHPHLRPPEQRVKTYGGWAATVAAAPPPADSGLDLGGARLRLLLYAIGLADQSCYGIQCRLWMEVRAGVRQPDDDPGAVRPILGPLLTATVTATAAATG
jgi:hypothetical protein